MTEAIGLVDAPDWHYAGDSLMTNFDHSVNHAIADKLRTGRFIADYPGWNFNAICWFADGSFRAAVWEFHVLVANYSAATPEALMEEISADFGSE